MTATFRSFAVVPAAGESRRMGRPKLLLPWRGGTVIETVLTTWRASSVQRIVVVVGPGDVALADKVRGDRVDVVIPTIPPPDMKASVLYGLDHLQRTFQPQPTDAWLLAPADLPHLPRAIIDEVLRSYDPTAPSVIVPTLSGKRGHPVLFPWQLVAEVHTLAQDEGLNALLPRHPLHTVRCDHLATVEAWRDLDTPEDYRIAIEHISRE
jgi:molybdenum cofactor cytidylyltransferase